MEISCNQCNQKYHLSEEKVDDRRVYFYCENCGHRIVIDRKREGWFSFLPLKEEPLTATSLFDAVFLSFNKKNILLTYLVLLMFALFGGMIALIVNGNAEFFIRHYILTGFLLYLLVLGGTLVFDLHLYLVSKNLTFRIEQGTSPYYRDFMADLQVDFPALFTVSAGLFLAFSLLLFPLYLMKSHFSLVYAGFFSGILLVLGFFFFISACFRDILIAFIAVKPRNFKDMFRSLFRFIAVENLNIPLYSFLNALVSGFLGMVIFSLIGGTVAIIFFSISAVAGQALPGSMEGLSQFMAGTPEAVDAIRSGGILAILFSSLVLLFLLAWFINLIQALAVTAVRIMSSNPGRSIHRGVLLAVMAGTAITLFLTLLIHAKSG